MMNCRRRCLVLHCLLSLLFAVVCQGCRCASLLRNTPPSSTPPRRSGSLPPSSTESRVDAIKAEILDKLGMDGAPDMERLPANESVETTQRILELYEETHQQLSARTHNISEETEEQAKQFYSFDSVQNYGRIPKTIRRRTNSVFIYFKVEVNPRNSDSHELDVTEATLKLFKNRIQRHQHPPHSDRKKNIRVKIYQMIRIRGDSANHGGDSPSHNISDKRGGDRRNDTAVGNHADRSKGRLYKSRKTTAWPKRGSRNAVRHRTGRKRFHRRLLQSRTVSLETTGKWEEFDVLEAAREWISDPSSNHGLLITTDAPNHSLRSVFGFRRKANSSSSNVDARSRKSPALTVFVRERLRAVRVRRSLEGPNDCAVGDGEGRRCCRFSLWISFADLGWADWILAPDGYLAHFCDGACPHRYRLANRFSSIKVLVNSRNPAAAPAPCCSATRMSPLTIAHYNQFGQAVISVFDDMIVEECRCT